ncbi:MAG TPA: hypothetical protein VFF40_00850 [Acidimicrobiia bacterium]|nr:hypothetical protein [Acidimicrobiia bacterium]
MPTTIAVRPWPDPVIDTLGHDPRSIYVETFWLPTLGPTSLLLLRHLAARFEHHPQGMQLDVATTAQRLGLGRRDGTSSPLVRSLGRLEQFDLACHGGDEYAVRATVPPINSRHLRRLPDALRIEHEDWATAQLGEPAQAAARRRARRLALALFEQGDDLGRVERGLHRVGFHPAICRDAAEWGHQRHEIALAAANAPGAA